MTDLKHSITYGGIPLEVIKQDKGELYNIIVPEDESKESAANEL